MVSSEEENEDVAEDGGETEVVLDLSGRKLTKLEKAPSNRAFATALVLDDNCLQNLTNLDSYGELQRISLSNNQVVRMYWFARMYSLRILNLPGNNIVTIEGLKELHHLVHLNLAANNIKSMEGASQCHKLQHLNLSGNAISAITDLTPLKNLKELFLHRNRLSCLTRCSKHLPPSLVILTLSDNLLSDLNLLCHLSHLTRLEQFTILNNPCLQPHQLTDSNGVPSGPPLAFDYRPYVINWCLNLKVLDGYKVTPMESLKGEWLYSQGRGRGFQAGEHGELVQYLSGVCLAGGGWGGAALPQHDLKLVKILQLAKQHQHDLRQRQGPDSGAGAIAVGDAISGRGGQGLSVSQHSSPATQRRGLHARPPPAHRRHTEARTVRRLYPRQHHRDDAHDAIPTPDDVEQDELMDFHWGRDPRLRHRRQASSMEGARLTHLQQQQQQQLLQQQQPQYHVELSSTLYGGGLKTPDTPSGLMTQSMDPAMLLGPLSEPSASLPGEEGPECAPQPSAMTRSLGPELLSDALNPRLAPCRSQQLHASSSAHEQTGSVSLDHHHQQQLPSQLHPSLYDTGPRLPRQDPPPRPRNSFPSSMTQSLGPEQLAQQLSLPAEPISDAAMTMSCDTTHPRGDTTLSRGNTAHCRADTAHYRGDTAHCRGDMANSRGDMAGSRGDTAHSRGGFDHQVAGYEATSNGTSYSPRNRSFDAANGAPDCDLSGRGAPFTNGASDAQIRPTCLFGEENGYGELEDCSQLSGSSTFMPAPESVISPDLRPPTNPRPPSSGGSHYGTTNNPGYQHQPQTGSRAPSPAAPTANSLSTGGPHHQSRSVDRQYHQYHSVSHQYQQSTSSSGHHPPSINSSQSSHQRAHQSMSAHQASHHAAEYRQEAGGGRGRGAAAGGQQRVGTTANRQAAGGGNRNTPASPATASPKLGNSRARTSSLKSPAVGSEGRPSAASPRGSTAASPKPSPRYARGGSHSAGGGSFGNGDYHLHQESSQQYPGHHSPGGSDSDNTDSEISVSKLQTIKSIAAERRMSERGRDTTPPRVQQPRVSSSTSQQQLRAPGNAETTGEQQRRASSGQPYNPDKYRPSEDRTRSSASSSRSISSRSNSATRTPGAASNFRRPGGAPTTPSSVGGRGGSTPSGGSGPVSRQTTYTREDGDLSPEGAALTLQRHWRGYVTRHHHPTAVAVRAEIRQRRAEEHIRLLQTKLQRAEESLERERRLRHLQLEAIRALWRQIGRLQAGRTTPASTPASTPLTPSTPMDASCKGLGGKKLPQPTEDTVKELTQFCDQLQGQVVSLQDSLSMVSQVMNAFCQLPGSQALLLSQTSSCSPMHSLSVSSSAAAIAKVADALSSCGSVATSKAVCGASTSGVGRSVTMAGLRNIGDSNLGSCGATAVAASSSALTESLSSLTSSITTLTSNIVTTSSTCDEQDTGCGADNHCGGKGEPDVDEGGGRDVGGGGAMAGEGMSVNGDQNSTAQDVSTLSHDISTLSHDVTLSHDDGGELSESSQSSMSCGSLSGSHSASHAGAARQVAAALTANPAVAAGPQRPSSLPVCREGSQHR